jgi:hypothetical protein
LVLDCHFPYIYWRDSTVITLLNLRLTNKGLRKHTKKCTPEEGPHDLLGIQAVKDQQIANQGQYSEDQHSLSLIEFLSEFLEDEGDEDAGGFHHHEKEGVEE